MELRGSETRGTAADLSSRFNILSCILETLAIAADRSQPGKLLIGSLLISMLIVRRHGNSRCNSTRRF